MSRSPLARLIQRVGSAFAWNNPEAWTTVNRANVSDYALTGRSVRVEGWEKHPVLAACTRAIVDVLQAVPLEVYTGEDDEIDILETHPLALLLQNPAPQAANLPGARFMGLTALHLLVYGNAFWEIRRPGQRGKPSGLKLIHPEYLRSAEYSDGEDRIVRYDWTQPETGAMRSSAAEDVVHFADLAAAGGALFGYPRAASALADVALDAEATRYVRQVVQNDGAATTIFHMADGATREQAEGAEARWRQKRLLRGDRGAAVFMPGTITTETVGFNLQQLEFPDLRRVTREDICAAFSVDPRVIGIASAGSDGGLSGVQYREARRRLISQAVSPLMFLLENHINHWLAPEYGAVRVRFSPNGLSELTEDELETSQRAIAEYQAGVRTLEEARRLVALPPEREPGDHIKAGLMGELTVADVTTLALATAQKALEPPEPPKQLAPGEAEAETPDEDAGEVEEAPQRVALVPVSRVAWTPEQRSARWQSFDQLARQHEAPLEAAALALFAADAVRVGRLFGQMRAATDPVLTPQEVEFLLREVRRLFSPEGPSGIAWAAGMRAPLSATVRAGSGMTGFMLPLPADPRFARVIANRTDRLVGLVGGTTAAQIDAAVLAGQQAGWGTRQTAAMIDQTIFGGLSRQRATLIARTETIGALNEGAYAAAQESGVITEAEWLTQQDDRVRDTHAGQDGTRLPLGATFPNGCRFPGDPMGAPEETIQCRCTLLYT